MLPVLPRRSRTDLEEGRMFAAHIASAAAATCSYVILDSRPISAPLTNVALLSILEFGVTRTLIGIGVLCNFPTLRFETLRYTLRYEKRSQWVRMGAGCRAVMAPMKVGVKMALMLDVALAIFLHLHDNAPIV